MSAFADLVARMSRISRHARVGLAAACADNVKPLYESLSEDNDSSAFSQSTDACWRFAETGQEGSVELERLCQRMKDLASYYYDDMDDAYLAELVTVALRALETMSNDEQAAAEAAARALDGALGVAESALEECEQRLGAAVEPSDEEFSPRAWKEATLAVAERHAGLVTKSIFAEIPPPEGKEVRDFLANREQAR